MGKYGFESMKVGDTLEDLSGGSATGDPKYANSMYIASVMYARRHGWRFSGKTIPGGVAVTRIA